MLLGNGGGSGHIAVRFKNEHQALRRSEGAADASRTLFDALLEVQARGTSPVSAFRASLPRAFLDSVEFVKRLMQKASTRTGLGVFVDVLDRFYETGLKLPNFIRDVLRIRFDHLLRLWNYIVRPNHNAEYRDVVESWMLTIKRAPSVWLRGSIIVYRRASRFGVVLARS